MLGPICANYITIVCGNNTCLNGGTCIVVGNRTMCQCPTLFTGTRCENLTNPCDSKNIYFHIFLFIQSLYLRSTLC